MHICNVYYVCLVHTEVYYIDHTVIGLNNTAAAQWDTTNSFAIAYVCPLAERQTTL